MSDTGKLISASLAEIGALFQSHYKMLAIRSVSGIQNDEQPAPTDEPSTIGAKTNRLNKEVLMRMVDRLNMGFGRDTVTFAATGRRRPWKLRRELLSPRYTTAWDQLLRV